jgi:hypothetical protein
MDCTGIGQAAPNVRRGSICDKAACSHHVRFTLDNGHDRRLSHVRNGFKNLFGLNPGYVAKRLRDIPTSVNECILATGSRVGSIKKLVLILLRVYSCPKKSAPAHMAYQVNRQHENKPTYGQATAFFGGYENVLSFTPVRLAITVPRH